MNEHVMNKEQLQHFDWQEFLRRMDGDEDDARFILEHTKDTIESIISDFRSAISSGDMELVRAAAHKIKGTSRSLTFDLLAEQALRLENLAKARKQAISQNEDQEKKSQLRDIQELADEIVEEFQYVKTLI